MRIETGLLLDVSGSMSGSIGEGIHVEGGTWIQSLFTVIDDFVKHDLSDENRVFAVAFGGRRSVKIFDTLRTLAQFQDQRPAQRATIEEAFKILEGNGARYIRKWAEKSTVSSGMREYQAQIVLDMLKNDDNFREKFVYDILPSACRDWNSNNPLSAFQWLYSSAVSTLKQASTEDIQKITKEAMEALNDSLLKDVNKLSSSMSAKKAADIIHGCVDERGITTQRAREYLKVIEPYIYGSTPLYAALRTTTDLYEEVPMHHEKNHQKLLFVLSDGEPTDGGDIDMIKNYLQTTGVKIVGCYISRSDCVEPKRLYSKSMPEWDEGAQFMFNLSSHIPTEMVTRAIFIKHGWQIDIENNETRLFMHVNHPDHLHDACQLARNAVCCHDALSELLVTISLDIYINNSIADKRVHDQGQEATCYAHAAATVVHLAMQRILGRDGGYPDFEQLRDDMINRHGRHGANTFQVLQEICPQYRLHCREINSRQAQQAITEKRLVVAKFRLSNAKWRVFDRFFEDNPKGILRKADIGDVNPRLVSGTSGHAVVLSSYNSQCLIFMNSYGYDFADGGFFKVENADVLGLEFIDVYWTSNDLSGQEKDYYHHHGAEVAGNLMRSIKALQLAKFICPTCHEESNVNEFRGTLANAICPKCSGSFSSNDGNGNILALNVYLTSLSSHNVHEND